jgi:glycosyltransferase involved in cell wall biosynthesis
MAHETGQNMGQDRPRYPRISIVTPNLNQGKFLEEAILSVIGQAYPNLEYIIMDGESTDHSVDIIKKYEKSISIWESKKDNGQADAINRGFAMASGDILGWLNSDDFYLPGALIQVAGTAHIGLPQLVYGDCLVIREDRDNRAYAMRLKDRENRSDLLNGSLAQSSAFWTKTTWLKVGPLDTKLHFAFDLDWFNRAKLQGIPFVHIPKHLSVFRSHEACKTQSGGEDRLREIADIYGRYRNKNYEDAFIDLLRQKAQVRKTERLLRKTKVLAGTGVRRLVFRRLFPALRSIADDDFDYFMKRIIGPMK